MSVCLVCTNTIFLGLSMTDETELRRVAHEVIQGMILGLSSSKASLKDLQLPHRGTRVVERCARTVEAPCRGCQKPDCPRCAIAAELRAAESRINAERDAELDDSDIEVVVDKLVADLCADHAAFGPALAGQWYGRGGVLGASTTVDGAHDS